MKNKYKISLPVIAECTKEDFVLTKLKYNPYKFVSSGFYQTSKIMCHDFYKPIYLKNSNDK
ncbi:hypothetical protein ACNQF7_01315 [Flavobacterium sp. RSP29]|uniref:hypothetical protein n=1 Tax=Flavobacterium sp. RSP29 TaxID=3401731 RepID=UPI003AAFA37F